MSLPGAYTGPAGSFPMLSPKELEQMEAPLMALASKAGDLRRLLHVFFAFLNRRTDFYLVPNQLDVEEDIPLKMGFKEGDAEKLLLAAFRQFPLRRMPRQGGGGAAAAAAKGGKGGVTTKQKGDSSKNKSANATTTADIPKKSTDGDAGKSSQKKENDKASSADESSKSLSSSKKKNKELEDPMADVRYTEEGKQKPVGNGGSTNRYRWTQTINETSVIIGVPEGTRGKDLDVIIKASSLSVRLTKAPPKKENEDEAPSPILLEGDLVEKIRTDESTWSLEGGALVLTLDKVKKTWWETVLIGDEKIDTTLVDSTRKIGEYDDATQGAIRKILFDQRQERLGLPTSDEILGKKLIPPLPPGVEYIDKETLDANTSKKNDS
uniref:CS domain-containing protein n=1 Tax=Ditylum brightwellii TaxID=49249 RepID=A0A7S4QFH4_9STRA